MNRDEIKAIANESGIDFCSSDHAILTFASRIESLVREAAEQDAKRYRWLRHNNGYSIFSNIFGDVEMHNFRDKDLDVAIDDQLENLAIRKSVG